MVSRERKRTRDTSVCTTHGAASLFEKSSREFTLCSFYRSSYTDNGHVQSNGQRISLKRERNNFFFFSRKRVKAKSIKRRILHFS